MNYATDSLEYSYGISFEKVSSNHVGESEYLPGSGSRVLRIVNFHVKIQESQN